MDLNQVPAPLSEEVERRHPTPEQSLIREAMKRLTPKQKKIWELYNFDRLTQDEIGKKLKISQQAVTNHIRACEKKIAKWVKNNLGAYELLKQDYANDDQ